MSSVGGVYDEKLKPEHRTARGIFGTSRGEDYAVGRSVDRSLSDGHDGTCRLFFFFFFWREEGDGGRANGPDASDPPRSRFIGKTVGEIRSRTARRTRGDAERNTCRVCHSSAVRPGRILFSFKNSV